MTLVSVTFSGYIVEDVVFIAGFVMGKQEGNSLNSSNLPFLRFLRHVMKLKPCSFFFRLTNEQRAAIADYFRVYKVVHCLNYIWVLKDFYISVKVVDSILCSGQ